MPKLSIDNHFVTVPEGATLLDAAAAAGIEIPTMCFRPGKPHFTSCMVCVVKDRTSGRMLPACSARAAEGMLIDCNSDAVKAARRAALELLLSDHIGDCEGPCHRVCPAHMNIPLMIRQIGAGDFDDALVTVKRDISLPAVLGRICPAPCEAGCRRKQIDQPVSICLLKRFVADVDLATDTPYRPPCAPETGKQVAIIGAGPTGLAAAYYLRTRGHACVLFDAHAEPGGALRTAVPAAMLPREVLDAEVALVLALGAAFRGNTRVGHDIAFDTLRETFDAVIVATGPIDAETAAGWGLPYAKRGLVADTTTYATPLAGVFTGGSAVTPTKLAVRAVGDGKDMVVAIDEHLRGVTVRGAVKSFNSVIGKLVETEHEVVLREGSTAARVTPKDGDAHAGFTAEEATRETLRCLHCDCRKPVSCRLRRYAEAYGAQQKRFKPAVRSVFEQVRTHPALFFEQRKCVSCGICVQITRECNEPLGLSFINRGMETRIGVPFNEPLERGLTISAEACVRGCPTGALSFHEGEDRDLSHPDAASATESP